MNEDKSPRRASRQTKSETSATKESLCPACGARARRSSARFCSTCGRALDALGYRPSDSLRASYHQHRARIAAPAAAPRWVRAPRRVARVKAPSQKMIFPHYLNAATVTALAFLVYSLVPCLGILFCPGAIVMGGVGLFQSRRSGQRAGRHVSALTILTGLLLFCAQTILWLLLHRIPQL